MTWHTTSTVQSSGPLKIPSFVWRLKKEKKLLSFLHITLIGLKFSIFLSMPGGGLQSSVSTIDTDECWTINIKAPASLTVHNGPVDEAGYMVDICLLHLQFFIYYNISYYYDKTSFRIQFTLSNDDCYVKPSHWQSHRIRYLFLWSVYFWRISFIE